MSIWTMRLALGIAVFLTPDPQVRAQNQTQTQSPPVWAQDVDISSLNIDEALQNYSPWTLLADSVAKSTTSRGKVQVEAHYVNPITYLHLQGGSAEGQTGTEERRRELRDIYGKYIVFYVLLRTPDDQELLKPDDWRVSVKTTGGKELAAEKVEGSEPELVSGNTGPVYQTKLMVYIPRSGADGKPTIDILKGDYLVASNKAHQTNEEMHWVSAASAAGKSSPLARILLKTFISLLFIALIALCILTRPGRDWLVNYSILVGEKPQERVSLGTDERTPRKSA